MKFPSGVLANGEASYRFNGLDAFTPTPSAARSGWIPLTITMDLRGRRSDGQQIDLADIDQFAAEMDDFAQCILNNRPSRVSGEEGLRDVKIMTAIYEAARTGKTVAL